ncbi:hypothetical protein D3C71_1448480 [compost metagenome]
MAVVLADVDVVPAGRLTAQAGVLGAQLVGPRGDGMQGRVRFAGQQAVDLGLGLRRESGFGDARDQPMALCAPGQGIGGDEGEGQRQGSGRKQGSNFHRQHSNGPSAGWLARIWLAGAGGGTLAAGPAGEWRGAEGLGSDRRDELGKFGALLPDDQRAGT